MIYAYAFKDTLRGQFMTDVMKGGPLFRDDNDNHAVFIRDVQYALNHASFLADCYKDVDLYCIGEFLPDEGFLTGYKAPQFICHLADLMEAK